MLSHTFQLTHGARGGGAEFCLITQHLLVGGMRKGPGTPLGPPPPAESDGPRQGGSTTRDHHPLGKMLSGWGSPTTARPSGRNRGCQPRSLGDPGFRTEGLGPHTGSAQGTPEYEWPGARCLSPPTGHPVCVGRSVWIVHGSHCHK